MAHKIMALKEPGRQKLVFYIPDSICDYAIVVFSGFGRPPRTYERMGHLAAESGKLAVISDWDDGGCFTERTMIESVYYPVDWLDQEVGKSDPGLKFRGVFGIGHSFGGERLLKAAMQDKKKRFAGVAAVQPPERLGRYIREHPGLYKFSKLPYVRTAAIPLMWINNPGFHVHTPSDQANLTQMIWDDSSLFDSIRAAPDYRIPTQILYTKGDGHVNYADALTALDLMRQNGSEPESAELEGFDKLPTGRQIEDAYGRISDFFDRVSDEDALAA
ncbi:MAG: hypothetical protein HY517_01705 [Candidatus Aenigmarchaeota archaeon]|nr:hypothetical protein [Candidatus Aenigmarchaeota archaeon]